MKILHLEDSREDAVLVHALLEDEWPECEITTVDTRDAFVAQLARVFDVILSDFTLVCFDGLEALKLARERAPDTPFIFVSGSIGEESAIEAVRHGAYDYVLKDRIRRLQTSIRRALGESAEAQKRRTAEAAHLRLVSILECTPDLVALTGAQGRITYLNRAGRAMLGVSEDPEADLPALHDLYPEEVGVKIANEALPAAIRNGLWSGESVLLTRGGRRIPISQLIIAHKGPDGAVEYLSTVMRDLTEKKQMEEQVLRAQRVETIGMLASGIAHDLNNVLAPIAISAPLLRQRASDPTDIKLLGALEKSAERGTDLVRQILAFARGSGGEQRVVQIKHIARDLISVITETFPKTITLDHSFPSDLWLVQAHPTQMHQVLLNLCVNARDAMPQGGKLGLRGKNVPLANGTAATHGMPPGNYLLLEVSDTGTGIPPDVVERMWEPFFTTKGADRGTGLGLSTVRGIIESHQGHVRVKTEAGRGTTFSVYLPASPS